jgi:transcriptional regulator with PAS, ATPase and Fis domain
MEKKLFREDLYYRLNVIPLTIPPLRERREDIPLLVNYMCEKFSNMLKKEIRGISQDTLSILYNYSWPGNVRELENAIEYAVNFVPPGSIITKEYLPPWLLSQPDVPPLDPENLKDRMQLRERQMLLDALETTGRTLAAKKEIAKNLNIGLATLYRKLKKYGIK